MNIVSANLLHIKIMTKSRNGIWFVLPVSPLLHWLYHLGIEDELGRGRFIGVLVFLFDIKSQSAPYVDI